MNHRASHTKNPSTPSVCYRSFRLHQIATELFSRIKDRLLFMQISGDVSLFRTCVYC